MRPVPLKQVPRDVFQQMSMRRFGLRSIRADLAVTLGVVKTNPALRLCERLGFRTTHERGLKSFTTAVSRLIAISSGRPILSVEKELGITPLPLSAEFSPFLIPLMVELVGAGFATTR